MECVNIHYACEDGMRKLFVLLSVMSTLYIATCVCVCLSKRACLCVACVHVYTLYVYRMHVCACMYSRGETIWVKAVYHILPVNSCGYYKFQVEIGAVTNRDFYIKIALKIWFSTLYCGNCLIMRAAIFRAPAIY